MMRAIIVDDEETVRRGLKRHYHWDKYGIEVAADFEDGASALEWLKNHPADLLVTDIVMPRMDGFSLAQQARALYEDIKIIFISGYTDAKFLWNALKMNAVDYIFKSIDFDELDAAVERVVHMVRRRSMEQDRIRRLEDQLGESRELLQQRQLVSLLSYSEESEEALDAACAALSLPLDSRTRYVLLTLRLSNQWALLEEENKAGGVLLDLEMQNTLRSYLRSHGGQVLFTRRAYEYVSILPAAGEDYADRLMNLSLGLQAELMRQFHAAAVIGLSEPFVGLKNARLAYKEAASALLRRYVSDDGLPQVAMKKYGAGESLHHIEEKRRPEIFAALMEGNEEKIRAVYAQAAAEMQLLSPEDERQNGMMALLLMPKDLLRDLPAEERGRYRSHRLLTEQYLMAHDPHEQEACVLAAWLDAAATLQRDDSPRMNSLIRSVCDYIGAHYADQLSIAALAEMVYLTPTYLCVLFKKNTGKTLNGYITDVRLDEACRRLNMTNIHLQDICYQVGYLSPSYFSRLFKSRFGVSPSQYRASLFQGEGGEGSP